MTDEQADFCGLCGHDHTTTEHYEAEWDGGEATDLTLVTSPGQSGAS